MGDEPEISIRLRSYDLDTMGAHHNAVSIYIGGEEAFTIHGLAIDRETGMPVEIGDEEDTLRALIAPKAFNREFDLPINGEHVIFEGSAEEATPKIAAALDAVKFINDQNLDYDPYRLFGTAQNSNSVANTIVTAMEVEFPEASEKYWAPGHDRILLPEGWSSIYTDANIPKDMVQEALSPNSLQKIAPETVIKQAMDDPITNRKDIYFDHEEPFSPYIPLGLDKPLEIIPAEPQSAPIDPNITAPKV